MSSHLIHRDSCHANTVVAEWQCKVEDTHTAGNSISPCEDMYIMYIYASLLCGHKLYMHVDLLSVCARYEVKQLTTVVWFLTCRNRLTANTQYHFTL